MNDEEKDYEAYKLYVQLWKDENPIKTNKLQVLLIVNGLLVSTLQMSGGFCPKNWFLFLAGAVFSLIWTLSIGRTSLYQGIWKIKAEKISTKYPTDPRYSIFQTKIAEKEASFWLRVFGYVSTKYYLLGTPIAFSIVWLSALLYALLNK